MLQTPPCMQASLCLTLTCLLVQGQEKQNDSYVQKANCLKTVYFFNERYVQLLADMKTEFLEAYDMDVYISLFRHLAKFTLCIGS
jgi:hypothetical protein